MSRLAEMTDFFCDADICYAMRDGKILYIDDNHISATAARDLGALFAEDMNWLLGKRVDQADQRTPTSADPFHRYRHVW